MDISQYLQVYIEEASEHLQSLNVCLLHLEKEPDNRLILDEIFRSAHTLKGNSGAMGFKKMQNLTHEIENVFDAVKKQKIVITTYVIDILFRSCDAIDNYLNEIIKTGSEGNQEYKEIIGKLKELSLGQYVESNKVKDKDIIDEISIANIDDGAFEYNEHEKKVLKEAQNMGMNVFTCTVLINKKCLLKTARAYIIFQTIERYAEIIYTNPKIEDIEDGNFDFQISTTIVSSEEASIIEKEIYSISEIEKVKISKLNILDDTLESEKIKENNTKDIDINNKVKKHNKHKIVKTVRVETEKLDVLLDLVSELIIQKTRLEEIIDMANNEEYAESLDHLKRVTTNIHDAVMKVRMVPIETVFSRFPRMIRDISKKTGKDVEFIMTGQETELDRSVVDEIGDPLIHLLRNAIDHGIETAKIRQKLGKSAKGKIFLRAYQDGNNVVIEIEDDGNGIDIERVREKAIEKNPVDEENIRKLSKKEIIELVFNPSFSTSDKVTDLSGRGVGLDVVKTKIEYLGGSIEVDTIYGKGSKFVIRLPLTLAIIKAMLFKVGDEPYAIKLSSIQEVVLISPEKIEKVGNQEVIVLRDEVIPIIRLCEILESYMPNSYINLMTTIIIKKGEKFFGLIVDDIMGQQEIVQKPLGKLLSGIEISKSATILGDGNVALILDVNSII